MTGFEAEFLAPVHFAPKLVDFQEETSAPSNACCRNLTVNEARPKADRGGGRGGYGGGNRDRNEDRGGFADGQDDREPRW